MPSLWRARRRTGGDRQVGHKALPLILYWGLATIASAAPSTSSQWQIAAKQDLQAIHDLLRDNSPAMVVDRDSAHFRSWLEDGLAQSQLGLPTVSNGRDYSALLTSYVAGFLDAHIAWWRRSEAKVSLASSDAASPRKLALQRWSETDWWITLPGMSADQDWGGFYDSVSQHLANLRSAQRVVIDLRGNVGGDSGFGDRLAEILWGADMVQTLKPRLGPTVWRVSQLNRDYWKRLVDERSRDPQGSSDADDIAGIRNILDHFDQAMAQGAATFELNGIPPVRKNAAGPNLMRGRVVLLTDDACVSACLDLMDVFTAMPGVVQAGHATSADTIFMEFTPVPMLPSGLSGFGYGQKAWIKRPRGSNQPYTPSPALTWSGPASDENGLRIWLRGAIQSR